MKTLDRLLIQIGNKYKNEIVNDSRWYRDVNIGDEAEKMGFSELKEMYKNAHAVVPLRQPVSGMKVRIDGRTFVDYAQFESGIAVPGYVARDSDLAHKAFSAKDSMVLNFA